MTKEELSFDDFLLVPQYSDIDSIENEISTNVDINGLKLQIPIISAAMTTVTEDEMMIKMRNLGGIGIKHRYFPQDMPETYKHIITIQAARMGVVAVAPSMGMEFMETLMKKSQKPPIVAIDVAHGDRKYVLEFAENCVKLGFNVWSGNIVSSEAVERYLKIGVKIMKVGIGPGSACSTRIVAGVGYPQASALNQIKRNFKDDIIILSDGGMKNSGDIVKALAVGADAVILGRLLAGTDAAPSPIEIIDGKPMKRYAGMASKEELSRAGKTVREEGVSGYVPYEGSLENKIFSLMQGVKAGMNYCGARNFAELRENVQFVRITQAGMQESMPRI